MAGGNISVAHQSPMKTTTSWLTQLLQVLMGLISYFNVWKVRIIIWWSNQHSYFPSFCPRTPEGFLFQLSDPILPKLKYIKFDCSYDILECAAKFNICQEEEFTYRYMFDKDFESLYENANKNINISPEDLLDFMLKRLYFSDYWFNEITVNIAVALASIPLADTTRILLSFLRLISFIVLKYKILFIIPFWFMKDYFITWWHSIFHIITMKLWVGLGLLWH